MPAWLGLTPKARFSGGKERLGGISKAGNRYLRRLLYLGAMSRSEPSRAIGSSKMANARRGKEAGTDRLSLMLGRKAREAGRGRAGQPYGSGRRGIDQIG